MAITLNHTIVPAHDKIASAKFFARMFGLPLEEGAVGYFAPVQVNETFTLDFHDDVDRFEVHHYAFKVSKEEFDAIFGRIQAEGIPLWGGASFARRYEHQSPWWRTRRVLLRSQRTYP